MCCPVSMEVVIRHDNKGISMFVQKLIHTTQILIRDGYDYVIRPWGWVSLCTIALLFTVPNLARADTAGTCDASSLSYLERAIEGHNHVAYRVDQKFTDVLFYRGPIPKHGKRPMSREKISGYLSDLGERKSAVLFHWIHDGALWTWLITSSGKTICAIPRALSAEDWKALDGKTWTGLGIRGATRLRGAELVELNPGVEGQRADWDKILDRLSVILLPPEVVSELTESHIDTLIVVPITIRHEDSSSGKKMDLQTALSLSAVPFPALRFGDGAVVDKLSVVVSPSFSLFNKVPIATRAKYIDPLVIGNPVQPKYRSLPGAEAEARYVAERLGTQAFVQDAATQKFVESYLKDHSKTVDFVHLATHGIADSKNPLDESFLVFSDDIWKARHIGLLGRYARLGDSPLKEYLPLLEGQPLVIMSACQTALGKDFPSGTIGLARAWERAGASNVVMSLWSVDDQKTKELMEQFVDLVASGKPVDKALQIAMVRLRDRYPNPSNWASFAVYGNPERLITAPAP